jgi:iron complex outermembrane receptor protein
MFWAEFRNENYIIAAGEEKSYAGYDINGAIVTPTTANQFTGYWFYGTSRELGHKFFLVLSPKNAVNKSRNSAAAHEKTHKDTDNFLSRWRML